MHKLVDFYFTKCFNQYGRKISDELYEFMEDVKYPDGTVQHIRETVNLNDYTEDQIIDVLCSYGYDYEEIKKSWKEKDVESPQDHLCALSPEM